MAYMTGLILLVIGLIACFFGKRFYRLILGLSGFAVGYYAVTGALVEQSEAVQIIGGIVAGLIVGFLFWTFYKFAYVLFGAFLGLAVAGLIGTAFNLGDTVYLILAIVLMLIGAVLGAAIADLMIRLATSFGGATQAIGGIAALAAAASINIPLADPTHGGLEADSAAGIITIVAVVALAVAGFLFQTRNDPEAA